MMKILFLDIDGVLCTMKSMQLPVKPFDPDVIFYIRGREGWDRFEPECVDRLNGITLGTDAKIVISSTWRLPCKSDADFRVLCDYLYSEGVQGEIIGKTPTHRTFSEIRGMHGRGAEIKEWLNNTDSDVEGFVILDDNEDMGDLMDHLVLTSHKTGLLDKHMSVAIKILNERIINGNKNT